MPDLNRGPIPGANYTSDTKNYPWRQPPEFTDLDEALNYMARKMTDFKTANGILTMAEMEVPLYKIADIILTLGMGEGKWTADYMLLMAGPLTRMIELMCIGMDVEYDLGIYDDDDDFVTGSFYNHEKKLREGGFEILQEEMPGILDAAEEQSAPTDKADGDLGEQGFMAMNDAPLNAAKGKAEEGK